MILARLLTLWSNVANGITHEYYRRVLRHLRENTLSASDLSRIQNALTFLSPLCRDTREAHKDMMGVTLKTDALLRANR